MVPPAIRLRRPCQIRMKCPCRPANAAGRWMDTTNVARSHLACKNENKSGELAPRLVHRPFPSRPCDWVAPETARSEFRQYQRRERDRKGQGEAGKKMQIKKGSQ